MEVIIIPDKVDRVPRAPLGIVLLPLFELDVDDDDEFKEEALVPVEPETDAEFVEEAELDDKVGSEDEGNIDVVNLDAVELPDTNVDLDALAVVVVPDELAEDAVWLTEPATLELEVGFARLGLVELAPMVTVSVVSCVVAGRESEAGMGMSLVAAAKGASNEPDMPVIL